MSTPQYFNIFVLSQFISDKFHQSNDSVAESSAETLNACGGTVRPADVQARFDESGRIVPSSITTGLK